MQKHPANYAFIDSTNLHLSLKREGWKLDVGRFRIFLRHKYNVQKAYMFIRSRYSALLRKFRAYFFFVSDLRHKLEHKKR